MKNIKPIIILLLCVSSLSCAAKTHRMPSETTWDRYTPSSLSIVKEDHQYLTDYQDCPAKFNFNFNGRATVQPYRTTSIYMNIIRKILPQRKELIERWGEAFNINPHIIQIFQYEMLFLEDSTEYWLPVQNQLLPLFQKELKKGDKVDLFVMAIGTLTYPDKTDWVFIVNEFRK